MKLADFGILSVGVALNAFAQLGLKAATQGTGPLRMAAGDWGRLSGLLAAPALWAALTAYGVSVVVWIIGLSRVPVSQAYPLLSMGYVLNIALAWMLLGETPTLMRTAGTLVIVAGVVMVAGS
ncbi:MAG: EamA family transporter [Steroidobacteraceae bacterium]